MKNIDLATIKKFNDHFLLTKKHPNDVAAIYFHIQLFNNT